MEGFRPSLPGGRRASVARNSALRGEKGQRKEGEERREGGREEREGGWAKQKSSGYFLIEG